MLTQYARPRTTRTCTSVDLTSTEIFGDGFVNISAVPSRRAIKDGRILEIQSFTRTVGRAANRAL